MKLMSAVLVTSFAIFAQGAGGLPGTPTGNPVPPITSAPVIPTRTDPFMVTHYGQCGVDDYLAGRDTWEEMRAAASAKADEAARLATEANAATCRAAASAAEIASKRAAAELAQKACQETVAAANQTMLKWVLKKCGFAAITLACPQSVLADAGMECLDATTLGSDDEWPPVDACIVWEARMAPIKTMENDLRSREAALQKELHAATNELARLSRIQPRTPQVDLAIRGAQVTLDSVNRRRAGLLEEVRKFNESNDYHVWVESELALCRAEHPLR